MGIREYSHQYLTIKLTLNAKDAEMEKRVVVVETGDKSMEALSAALKSEACVSSRPSLVWDESVTCENDFRSYLLGKPIYDMHCAKCLNFVGAYHSPEDCKDKFCANCGAQIQATS